MKEEALQPDFQIDLEEEGEVMIQARKTIESTIGVASDTLTSFFTLDGIGTRFGMLNIIVGWALTLGLVIELKVPWPQGWYDFLSWIQFPTFAWSLVLPSSSTDLTLVLTLLQHPAVLSYAFFRFKFFANELPDWIGNQRDCETEVVWGNQSCYNWRGKAVLAWLAPAAALGTAAACALALDDLQSGIFLPDDDDEDGSLSDGSLTAGFTNGSTADDETSPPLIFGDYLFLVSLLWFGALELRAVYKEVLFRRYRAVVKVRQENAASKFFESSSNLGGSNSPTPNYPKNHVKKIKLTLPICKRDYVTH
eukprot:SAG11_NODE_582_length_8353_cov_28.953356_7_plen_307_part_01